MVIAIALFGLLAVALAERMQSSMRITVAVPLFLAGLFFVYRSFYGMRITSAVAAEAAKV